MKILKLGHKLKVKEGKLSQNDKHQMRNHVTHPLVLLRQEQDGIKSEVSDT